MQTLIEYFAELEHTAAQLYRKASGYFAEDAEFSGFLKILADDEQYHYEIMRDLTTREYVADVMISEERKSLLLSQIEILLAKLENVGLSKNELLQSIIETEFSEWNDLFIFTITAINEQNPEFKRIAAKIQNHLDKIECFIIERTGEKALHEQLKSMQRIWDKRILIVDDDDIILKLLARIFGKRFLIDEAKNGKEALQAVESRYYDVIVSDVNMPDMNGFDLFEKLKSESGRYVRKFIFLTGDRNHEGFFKAQDVKYFFKPFPLDALIASVDDIILKAVEN